MWHHLSQTDLPRDDPFISEALRRLMARLGEFTEMLAGPLKIRPTGATLLSFDSERVEVRISASDTSVILVIAPEGDLAPELFFLRSLAQRNLPARRVIECDLSRTLVPFTYVIESHVGGSLLDPDAPDTDLLTAARQLGRALWRVHQLPAPGFGWPTIHGRWVAHTWREALLRWLGRDQIAERARALLGAERAERLWAATRDHAELQHPEPAVLHGAVMPECAIVTAADSMVRLEALTRPGPLVAGDPLFDLALGTQPVYPAAFRRGLLDGYVSAAGPLNRAQERRLRRLRLLVWAAEQIRDAEEADRDDLIGEVDRLLNDIGI
jgi:hypothetical protein